ncbi:MAG: hypothetical protein Q9184_003871 [Pyrenodesmia sp. 2 TL-2023]
MSSKVLPCSVEDLTTCSRIQWEASASNPFWQTQFPRGGTSHLQVWTAYHMRREYETSDIHFFKIVDVSAPDKIVGYAKWTVEGGDAERGAGEGRATTGESIAEDGTTARLAPFDPPDVPEQESRVELFNDWMPELVKKRHQYLVEPQTVVLDDLWILPDHQRRGLGTMLLKCFVDYADKRGWPCYLESTPLALPMYLSQGFREIDGVEINLANCREGYGLYKSAVLYRNVGEAPAHQKGL